MPHRAASVVCPLRYRAAVGALRRISVAERRARLGLRHHLAPPVRTGANGAGLSGDAVATVAGDLIGLHATDPAAVFLQALSRMAEPSVEAVSKALYEDRSVVRMLGMRRTMFAVPAALAPVVHASSTLAIAARERLRLAQALEDAGITADGDRWVREVEAAVLEALASMGQATAAQLAKAAPAMATKITVGEGKKWGGTISVSNRLLTVMAADGGIVRGRPGGGWTSTQYQWAPTATWLDAEWPTLDPDAARIDLLGRWLATYGPATAADAKWWSGWTANEVKRALAAVGPVEVELDEGTAPGLVLADDVEPVVTPEPWAALLPALDQAVMGWSARDWFLGGHRGPLFDRSGNVGPTVWWNGRIVGGWAQRSDGELVLGFLEDVGVDGVAAIDREVDRLVSVLGERRFTPKFRTPLERELSV